MKRQELDIHVQLAERWPGLEENIRNELLQCMDHIANAYGVSPSRLRLTDRFSDLSNAQDCGGFSDGDEEVEAILCEKGLPNISASDQIGTLLQAIVDAIPSGARGVKSSAE